jgi:hypothetical protein
MLKHLSDQTQLAIRQRVLRDVETLEPDGRAGKPARIKANQILHDIDAGVLDPISHKHRPDAEITATQVDDRGHLLRSHEVPDSRGIGAGMPNI